MDLINFSNKDEQASALAKEVAKQLAECININGTAKLCVPGGSTPALFLQALFAQPVTWEKVAITLTDERWVAEDSGESNLGQLLNIIKQAGIQHPWIVSLKTDDTSPGEALQTIEDRLTEEIGSLDVVITGMGTDGHFASLFPEDPCLVKGLDSSRSDKCVAVTSQKIPRISLTLPFFLTAKHIYLLITGQSKRAMLDKAQEPPHRFDASTLPIRALINQTTVPFTVYWAP